MEYKVSSKPDIEPSLYATLGIDPSLYKIVNISYDKSVGSALISLFDLPIPDDALVLAPVIRQFDIDVECLKADGPPPETLPVTLLNQSTHLHLYKWETHPDPKREQMVCVATYLTSHQSIEKVPYYTTWHSY